MLETSTKALAEDVDTAIRDAYHALRNALHKVEDLKMRVIREPDVKPFGLEDDEMYKMYLDLSKRFQATREEIRDRSGPALPQPPAPIPEPAPPPPPTPTPALVPVPRAEEPRATPTPVSVPVPSTEEPRTAPAPVPVPTPITEEPRTVKLLAQRSKSRPYVLVPPRKLALNTPAPPPNTSANRRRSTVPVRPKGPLKGKRKVAEQKDEEPSGSESGTAVEHCSPIKRMKTHHAPQKVNNKVDDDDDILMFDDPERWGSPLTELSSASPVPPLTDTAPPPGRPDISHANPRSSPPPPSRPSGVPPTVVAQRVDNPTPAPVQKQKPLREQAPRPGIDREIPRSEAEISRAVPEPLPTPIPASTTSLAASGSRPDEPKAAAVSTDKKPKLNRKKKYGPDYQFNMDDTLLDRRLLAVGPDFEVENDRITHQQVGPNSRATMSYIFGGNIQRMISYPSPEKRRVHGFNFALLFPSRKYNPHLPTKIGERGLLFRLDQKLEKWADNEGGSGPYHLMMHHSSDDYCYFGVYEFVRVDPVTKDEWLSQLPQVKENWVNHALKTYTGEQTRARVFLRRNLGREPTRSEVDATKGDKSIKGRVTPAQIMQDFNSGNEQLVIWGMKCVGYSYEFEGHLADNLLSANARTKAK